MSAHTGVAEAIRGSRFRLKDTGLAWNDMRITLARTQPGAAAPAWTKYRDNGAGSTGVSQWQFNNGVERELQFEVQLPHDWKVGTALKPHLHWSTTVAPVNGQTVIWGIEYTWANVRDGANLFGLTTLDPIIFTWNTANAWEVSYAQQIVAFTDINPANMTISAVLAVRLYRTAGGTFAQPVFAHSFDLHYQVDSVGSDAEYTKVPGP